MSVMSDNYQVLYSDVTPTTPIRLGQLLVDESEAAPLDMLKYCSSLGPPVVYTSISDAIVALFPVGANPTASVGLAAVNGSAATFMRSDAAPALSQSIIPTWTGSHTFNGAAIGGSAVGTWSGVHTFQANTVFQSLAGGGDASSPAIRFSGDVDSGFYQVSTSNVIGVSLGGINQIRFDGGGIPVKITGTSNASQPSCRFSHYTTDFATERGYWGYPTSASDTMLMRNVVGDVLQFRLSGNTNVIEINATGIGFNNATPIARPNYTITNPTTNRSLDVAAAAIGTVRQVLGTVIQDLIDYGLYQ